MYLPVEPMFLLTKSIYKKQNIQTMPLTLTISQDAPLPFDKLDEAVQRLSNAFLKRHGLLDNTVMTPNVTANVVIVPKGLSFSGGDKFAGVWVEWKVPSFAFASREIQKGYGQDAVDIILDLSDGKQPKENIYFNVVHTVDGAWNLDGTAMSNKELGAAIGAGAPDANHSSKSILLIHGAWGGAWEFEETLQGLRKLGYNATAIDLPGHGELEHVPIAGVTMNAYVEHVIEAVNAIDGRIVLVGHSLGGSIISQVAERIPEKIERLVYVAAILPKNGDSALALMQSDPEGQLLSRLVFSKDGSYATVSAKDVKEILLHDVKEPERLARFLSHFEMKQAIEPFAFVADLTDEAFGSVPKTYIRASIDKVVSRGLQEKMISSSNVDQVLVLESGHFPLMSIPERLVDVLDQAAKQEE